MHDNPFNPRRRPLADTDGPTPCDRHVREIILDSAAKVICGQKEEDYGAPEENFARIAKLWSVTLGIDVQPWQVCMCLGQVKDARLMHDPKHWDSWVDRAGYTGLGAELAMRPKWPIQEGEGE